MADRETVDTYVGRVEQSDIVLRPWYVEMRDGVRLAVGVWLPANLETPDPRSTASETATGVTSAR